MPRRSGNPVSTAPAPVDLPLNVLVNRGKNLAWGWLMILLGVAVVPLAALLAAMPVLFLLQPHWTWNDIWVGLLVAVFGPTSLVGAIQSFVSGFVCLSDARRRSPVLIIDADGLTDHRSGARIAWSDIVHIEAATTNLGVLGLALKLKAPPDRRASRFRVGALGFYFDRADRPIYRLALAMLQPTSSVLIPLIEQRVRAAGARIDRQTAPP